MLEQSSNQTTITTPNYTITSFSYYEYKYAVEHHELLQVKALLDEFCEIDPFPCGIVDSIYYDTSDQKVLNQCINGDANKCKFRIRGYGNGEYVQMHQKFKELSSVSKYKTPIKMQKAPREIAPNWDDLQPIDSSTGIFDIINHNARGYGQLLPSVRIMYWRYRYRLYDYRITLDTNIEAFAPLNGRPLPLSHVTLPNHVLEIKTAERRPNLPFNGLMKLPQISFSKFMLGLQQLSG